MRALLSIKLWFIFIGKMLKVLFPTMWVTTVFAVIGRKKIIVNSGLYFILIFIGINLIGRLFILFAGVAFQQRYLYLTVISALIFSGLGIVEFSNFLETLTQKYLPKKKWFTPQNIFIFTVALVVVINCAKGLRPRFDKTWIRNIPNTILKHTPTGKKPVLITGFDEFRLGFYANATFIRLKKPNNILTNADVSFSGSKNHDFEPKKGIDDYLTIEKHLANDGTITFKFKNPVRYRILYFDLFQSTPPDGHMTIKVKRDKPSQWQLIYSGVIKQRVKLFKIKHITEMMISFNTKSNIFIDKLYLARYLRWDMFEKGSGFSCEEWLPVFKETNIATLNHNLRALGNGNVFLLLKGAKEEWLKEFKKSRINISAIKEFKNIKKNTYTLFRVIEHNESDSQ